MAELIFPTLPRRCVPARHHSLVALPMTEPADNISLPILDAAPPSFGRALFGFLASVWLTTAVMVALSSA
jgi:hypothetical protein